LSPGAERSADAGSPQGSASAPVALAPRRMTVLGGAAPKVAGLVKMSTTDWPGKLAAVVFLQGCPWRCVYCHNEAILDPKAPGTMAWDEVFTFLKRRRGLLDGVVFSGGEPLIDAALPAAIKQVRDLGFEIGLHTGGAWPKRLAALLGVSRDPASPLRCAQDDGEGPLPQEDGEGPLPQARTSTRHSAQARDQRAQTQNLGVDGATESLVDWVGLDVKHLRDKYAQVTGVKVSGQAAFESLNIVVESGVSHEVRTTIDPTVHTHDDVVELIAQLQAYQTSNGNIVQKHVLQEARPNGAAQNHADAFTTWRLRHLIAEHEAPEVARRAA